MTTLPYVDTVPAQLDTGLHGSDYYFENTPSLIKVSDMRYLVIMGMESNDGIDWRPRVVARVLDVSTGNVVMGDPIDVFPTWTYGDNFFQYLSVASDGLGRAVVYGLPYFDYSLPPGSRTYNARLALVGTDGALGATLLHQIDASSYASTDGNIAHLVEVPPQPGKVVFGHNVTPSYDFVLRYIDTTSGTLSVGSVLFTGAYAWADSGGRIMATGFTPDGHQVWSNDGPATIATAPGSITQVAIDGTQYGGGYDDGADFWDPVTTGKWTPGASGDVMYALWIPESDTLPKGTGTNPNGYEAKNAPGGNDYYVLTRNTTSGGFRATTDRWTLPAAFTTTARWSPYGQTSNDDYHRSIVLDSDGQPMMVVREATGNLGVIKFGDPHPDFTVPSYDTYISTVPAASSQIDVLRTPRGLLVLFWQTGGSGGSLLPRAVLLSKPNGTAALVSRTVRFARTSPR